MRWRRAAPKERRGEPQARRGAARRAADRRRGSRRLADRRGRPARTRRQLAEPRAEPALTHGEPLPAPSSSPTTMRGLSEKLVTAASPPPRPGRTVPPARGAAPPGAGRARHRGRSWSPARCRRRQDADGDQPRADAQRVVPAPRAADRRRPAAAAVHEMLQRAERHRAERRASLRRAIGRCR